MKTHQIKNMKNEGARETDPQSRRESGSSQTNESVPRGTLDSNAKQSWRGIFFRGPASRQDKEGEEQPEWHVYLGDDQGEPVRTVYHVHSFKRAESLARVMSTDRNLELIAEAILA